ncbi:hypothetical protein [Actinokineospora alba]|uniref:hypothetical protein n=1 Tax=Actinokineospora alba TaxID=504798 RepID=UPI001414D4DD|nr:hypothetical protein [Actinokineospora alba]
MSSGRGTKAPGVAGSGGAEEMALARLGVARRASSATQVDERTARITKISQLQLDVNKFTEIATAMFTNVMAAAVAACLRVDVKLTPQR